MGAQPSEFGRLVRQLRDGRGWTQEQLARKAGLTTGYIGAIEAGQRGKRPSREVIISIARALDEPPAELLRAAGRGDAATTADRRQSFEQFVKGDPLLRQDEREMLIQLYRSYVGHRR